jgi:hypothetical protein
VPGLKPIIGKQFLSGALKRSFPRMNARAPVERWRYPREAPTPRGAFPAGLRRTPGFEPATSRTPCTHFGNIV